MERRTGIYQADKGACHTLKRECVVPGVQKKGNDHYLLSSIIAAYEHISLFGSHNTQLADRRLKPHLSCIVLPYQCSSFMPVSHYSKSRKQKQALSFFVCPSLITASWFWKTQPRLFHTQCENPSSFANFPFHAPSHDSFRDEVFRALQEAEIIF